MSDARPGLWRRIAASRPGRTAHALVALSLAALIIIPALPHEQTGKLGKLLRVHMGELRVSQRWAMYTPDPSRVLNYLDVIAELPDGSTEPLVEREDVEHGWGTHWFWTKSRVDIWRYYTTTRRDKPNPNRTAYLMGVCVREDRLNGAPPRRLTAYAVRRRINPPGVLLAGGPELGPKERVKMQTLDCRNPIARAMIKDDRARRGEG